MTRAQISTLIAGWLDDPNQTYFTPSLVNTWINLAQRQVQGQLLDAGQNWYVIPVETTLVANQADYVLPSDFVEENRLELVLSGTGINENKQPIKPVTLNEQDWVVNTGTGTPIQYYIKKDRITLLPTPSQAYTMRLYYSPRVADLSADSDSPDVPEQFMEYVAIIAAFNGFIKDDRAPENLLAKKNDYEEVFRKMKQDRTKDQSRQVVMASAYDFGGLV